MKTPPTSNPYKRHRFPAEVISYCVWLYFRFCLSYRDVEELMAERGLLLVRSRAVLVPKVLGRPMPTAPPAVPKPR